MECNKNNTWTGSASDIEEASNAWGFGNKKAVRPSSADKLPTIKKKMATVEITRGLRSSEKQSESVSLETLEDYLQTHHDCYERTNPTEKTTSDLNRVYVDLDSKDISYPADLPEKIADVLLAIRDDFQERVCIMVSNGKHKLSYRLHFTHLHGTKKAIKHFVLTTIAPLLKEKLGPVLPVLCDDEALGDKKPYLNIDTGVYNPKGRKMRMLYSSKDGENRPMEMLVPHPIEDSLITLIRDDSECLPEPVEPEPKPASVQSDPLVVSTTDAQSVAQADSVWVEDKDDLDLIVKVMNALPSKRCDNYDDWLRVGIICFNEGLACEAWNTWSQRSKKFKAGVCAETWSRFRKGPLTQATLFKWLKEDNPTAFAELSPQRSDLLRVVKNFNHAEGARLFFNMKPDGYLFHESLGWFQLSPFNTWKLYEKAPSGLLTDVWETLKKMCMEMLPNHEDEDDIKAIMGYKRACGNKTYVDGVIAFLPMCYAKDDLPKLMDENRHLFAFTDKVYDLKEHIVRSIKPSDYISLTTGYAFPKPTDPTARQEICAWLDPIWEDEEIKQYALRCIADSLFGTRRFERFFVWTGKGGNGKGLMAEQIKRTLGDYYYPIPNEILTKSADRRNEPNPVLAKARAKRFVQAQEPEASERLQVGMIKQLTGGDAITYRQLYKDPITYVPQYNLFIQCNEVPMLSKPDGGIQRRLEILEFPFQFVSNPTLANERKGDAEMKGRIIKSEAWRDEFFWMLIDAFKTIGSDWITPQKVKTLSGGYIDENNPVAEWLNEHYERVGLDDHAGWQVSTELRNAFNESVDGVRQKQLNAKAFTSYLNLMKVPSKDISAGTKRGPNLEACLKGSEKVFMGLKLKVAPVEAEVKEEPKPKMWLGGK